MPYDAALFDLDDTLTVTRRVKFEMHKAIARECYGRELSDNDIGPHYNLPLEQSMRGLHGGPDTPTGELLALLRRYQERFPHRLQPGALTVVTTLLAAGLDIGVVTGSPESVALPVLSALGFPIAQLVGVYCYNSSRLRKPDPAVFDEVRAALRARHAPDEPVILYIGDGLEDHTAARAAGVDFLGVTTGTVTAQQFRAAGARCCVPDLASVVQAVLLTRPGDQPCLDRRS